MREIFSQIINLNINSIPSGIYIIFPIFEQRSRGRVNRLVHEIKKNNGIIASINLAYGFAIIP